jgi:hypothetical protein
MSKSTESFLQDLQFAYAEVLERIFNSWTHIDDGGCNYEATGKKQLLTFNSVQVVYQPVGTEPCWFDDAYVIIFPKKDSGNVLTKSVFTKLQPLLETVEEKLIDSFNGFVQKCGDWIEPIGSKKITFNQMTSISEPLYFDEKSGKLKMKWEIKSLYAHQYHSQCWNPVELINWKHSLPAFIRHNEFETLENVKEINKYVQIEMKQGTEDILKASKLNSESVEYKEITEKIKNLYSWISLHTENIKKLEESLSKPYPLQKNYTNENDDVETTKHWFGENTASNTEKIQQILISYKDAFPERQLSGRKRSR